MINQKRTLPSVIDFLDTKETFELILNFFDPFKSKNKKTRVLDMGSFYYWDENYVRYYDVMKTKNLDGYAKDKRYNIIIYEPPKNNKFIIDTKKYTKLFQQMMYKFGIVIVKTADFRKNGQLKGTHDIINVFLNSGYVLYDNVIYKNVKMNKEVYGDHSIICHHHYLIFKRIEDTIKPEDVDLY